MPPRRQRTTSGTPSLADRAFRAVLRLFPFDFRSQYGREMEQVFREQRLERAPAGLVGLVRLWAATVRDLVRTAPGEHLAMLRQDAGYAWRMMRREPTFALTAILVLALGIGANTAIFSVVHAVVLRPLPFPESDRLYYAWGDHPRVGIETASLPDFADWRAQNDVFAGLAAYSVRNVTLAAGGDAERVLGARVTDGFFRVLALAPVVGRDFRADEDRPGAPPVVILGDALWRRRFGGDRSVIGRAVTIEGLPFTVVGIAPRGFAFPEKVEMWTPLAMSAQAAGRRNDFLWVIGRLERGVSPERAQATMRTIASRLERQYPDTNTHWSVKLVPARDQIVGKARPALVALWGAVTFLLLVACSNVANLLVARGAARTREMAIRGALGAGRTRLVRQSLTESVLFAVVGGALGLLFAWSGIALLVRFGPPETPRLQEAGLQGPVLAFTLAVSLATGLLFGLVPASRVGRSDVHDELKQGGRHGAGRSRVRLGSALVAVQMAVSVVLLIGAALMAQSFTQITRVEPGFATAHRLTFRLSLPAGKYASNAAATRGFLERVLGRLQALPGVANIAATNSLYLVGGTNYLSFGVEGAPRPAPDDVPDAQVRSVTPGFHRTLAIPLLRGRTLADTDAAGAPLVAVVNASFARRHFPRGDAIGHRVSYDGVDGQPSWREIVGIVGDARQDALDVAVYPEIDVPFAQAPSRAMTIVIESDGDLAALVPPIRAHVRQVDAAVPMFDMQSMEEAVGASIATRQFSACLLAVFAVAALLLAACGLYGVVAYRVARARQEIGVRVALGAGPAAIVWMVVGRGMRAALVGLAFGVPGAWVLSEYLRGQLFGVQPHDPGIYGAVALLLLVTCAIACYLPARRATRVDPLTALRSE